MITTVSFAFQRVGSAVPAAIHGFHYACEFGQRSRGEAVWFPGSGRSARKSGSQKWNSDSRGHPLTISISAPLSFSLPLFPPLSLSLSLSLFSISLSSSLFLSLSLFVYRSLTLAHFLYFFLFIATNIRQRAIYPLFMKRMRVVSDDSSWKEEKIPQLHAL